MSGSARTRSEQSCNARVLRTNESKCNRPEDSDVLSDTHSGRVSAARGARDEPRQLRRTAEMGRHRPFPICVAVGAEIVVGLDGCFSSYMGERGLAYFRYPQAHEDDAEQAVQAGLGVVDPISRLDVTSVKSVLNRGWWSFFAPSQIFANRGPRGARS